MPVSARVVPSMLAAYHHRLHSQPRKEMRPMKLPRHRPTRRRFLQSSVSVAGAALAFPLIVPSRAFGANDRLAVAAVGTNGKGAVDINGAAGAGTQIVALCDVDERSLDERGQQFPQAKR